MSKSFSITSYKGIEVKGEVIADLCDSTIVLVEETLPPTPPQLWIIDMIEDVGVALSANDIHELVPLLQRWVETQEQKK